MEETIRPASRGGTLGFKAVIAGGGLAGLACAKRLLDAGLQVELVEAEPQFGGRCSNWTDPSDGVEIESGVHTFFGVYSHLIRLMNEVGVDDDTMVSWDDRVGFLQPEAQLSLFAIDPIRDLPRVIGGLLGNNELLGPLSKLAMGFTILNGLLQRDGYETRTVAKLARDGGLNRETYERIFRPLARGLAFAEPEELSAFVILTLLNHGVTNPLNLRTGTFRGGMSDVMANPIARWIERNNGVTRTSTPVQTIHYDNGKIVGFELANGEMLTGDVYISALPIEIVKKTLPQPLQEIPFFQNIYKIQNVPATSVQLWFDRRFVSRKEFIFLAGSPLVVFQDESHISFPGEGSRISGQITARYTDNYSDQQYIDLALEELHRYIPASANATLQKAVIVHHQAPLFVPGTYELRPLQTTPITNFFLAGDYTRQKWFTTMEGATRSGEMAASGVVRSLGITPRTTSDGATASDMQANFSNAVRSGLGRVGFERSPLAGDAARNLNRIASRFIQPTQGDDFYD